jgi:hypothetical protein
MPSVPKSWAAKTACLFTDFFTQAGSVQLTLALFQCALAALQNLLQHLLK